MSRGRRLGFFGNLFDNRNDFGGGLQNSGMIPSTENEYMIDTDDEQPMVSEDNLNDYYNKTGAFLEPTMGATNRGSADPANQRLPSANQRSPNQGLPSANQPLSHNELHSESHTHQEAQQQDGATPEMTHNLSSGEKSSGGGVIAMSNERPTYDGKQNDSHKIIDKVIDALSDAMTQYLLKDKRILKSMN